ncbi:MAG TPA: TetR/AcrR family transcriptional regulator, partial [Candidatus Kurthia intestinigallinarum]|nr:TetR/AcrR family transcriptional regulator [Candidatus Kurthia intestinigallinarum]
MRKLTVKERVVEAALDLFQEKGYHGVSVEELVEHAETSKGGFYHHFKSKDDLLYEIHDIFISYVLNETKRASEQYDSAIDQLDALMRTFMNVFNIYQRHITVFYNESVYLLPNHEEAITKKRTAYRKLLEQILINGQRQQVFRQELSITITAMLII